MRSCCDAAAATAAGKKLKSALHAARMRQGQLTLELSAPQISQSSDEISPKN
jgi:hypothetical protein